MALKCYYRGGHSALVPANGARVGVATHPHIIEHHNSNGPDAPIGAEDPASEAVRRNEDGSVEW